MAKHASSPPLMQFLDIPVLTNWRQTDSVETLRQIMIEHEQGFFLRSSLFVDEMLTDDRIAGVLGTRIGGLLSAPVTFQPSDNRRLSRKLAKLLGGSDETEDDGLWLRILGADAAREILKWKIMLGFAVGEIVWQTEDGQWTPRVIPWHPRYARWDWADRCFRLSTNGPTTWNVKLPRTDVNTHGDGKWFVWGRPYSWMTGAIRALGMKFIDRQWNERDWSRYGEKHGMAIIEGKVPSGTDEAEKNAFESDLSNLGNETTIITPQAPQGEPSYGIELHEATAKTWDTFLGRKTELDKDIAILLLGQNLTTDVAGGSFAAAQVHDGIRLDVKRSDAQIYQQVRQQVLVPWAAYNWGDADQVEGETLAPYPRPQIDVAEDEEREARTLSLLGDACSKLQTVAAEVDVLAILESAGIPLREIAPEEVAPNASASGPQLTPTAQSSIITVNEARAMQGLGPWSDGDGLLTVTEFQAKHSGDIAAAVNAEAGGVEPSVPVTEERATSLLSTASQATLSASSPAASRRAARYQDAVTVRARRLAARALEAELSAVREQIDAATGPEDLKKRILRLYPKMSPTKLAKVFEKVGRLGATVGAAAIARRK